MGRAVRRVADGWQHPRNARNQFVPLRAADFAAAAAAWDAGQAKWDRGLIATHSTLPGVPAWRPRDEWVRAPDYEKHAGPRPRAEEYMPTWPDADRIAWQMYETTSLGTPVSPPLPSPEALAAWLSQHEVEVGPGITATAAEWLAMIRGPGSATIFVMERGVPVSAIKLPPPPLRLRFFRWLRGTPACD